MLRKSLNYIVFGVIVMVVFGIAMRHSQFVHHLVMDMGSADPKVQSAAALELIKTEQFSDAITGELAPIRVNGASALQALGSDASVVPDPAVKDATDYRSWAVKQAIGLLKDTDVTVRERAVLTLQKIGDATPNNLKELVNGIGDGDNYVRKGVKAAFIAAQSGIGPRPGVVEAIVAKMKADANTRAPGGDILSSTLFTAGGNPNSVPLLIALLTTKDEKGYTADEGARGGAADALGKIGDPKALITLEQSMHLDTPLVRRVSIGAIALIANSEGEVSLVEAIKNPDDDKQARSQAAAGLGKIGTNSAIAVLIDTLEDKDQDIRAAAVGALARAARPSESDPINPKVLSPLTKALASSNVLVRLGSARSLQAALVGGTDKGQSVENVCKSLIAIIADDKNDDDLRSSAATALGFEGDRTAVTPLIAALSDPSGSVSLAARNSLASIGSSATAALIAVIKLGNTNAYYAAQALTRQGAAALPALQATAADAKNPVGQRWAAVALGDLGLAGANATLRELARSSNEDVSYVAKEQLSRLGQAE